MPVKEDSKKKEKAMRIMITPGDICLSEEEEEFVIDIINDTVKRMKKKKVKANERFSRSSVLTMPTNEDKKNLVIHISSYAEAGHLGRLSLKIERVNSKLVANTVLKKNSS